MGEGPNQAGRKDRDRAGNILEKALISIGIVVASTLAGAVWATLMINGASYNQNLQGSLLGFLVGVTLVLTALLAMKR